VFNLNFVDATTAYDGAPLYRCHVTARQALKMFWRGREEDLLRKTP
jgi:hypothetical protein